MFTASAGCVNRISAYCGDLGRRLDGVRHLDELMLEPESIGDDLAEPAYSERLGRVVAGGDEVDPSLAGIAHRLLGRLTGYQRVQPERRRLLERARPGAADDPDAADRVRPGVEDERLAPDQRGNA